MHDARSPSRPMQSFMAWIAAALFAAVVLAAPAQADPPPTITATVDPTNHLVVDWPANGHRIPSVYWNTDPALDPAAGGGGSVVGVPLACIWTAGGSTCTGQQFADTATSMTSTSPLETGTYYVQVQDNFDGTSPSHWDDWWHYSNVVQVTVNSPVTVNPPGGSARLGPIEAVEGEGTIVHGDGTTEPAAPGIELQDRDWMFTKLSRLKLTFANGIAIVLDSWSSLEILDANGPFVDVGQRKGRIWYSLTSKTRAKGFAGRRTKSYAECRRTTDGCTFVAEQRKGRTWYQVYGRSVRVSGNGNGDNYRAVLVKKGFETVVPDATLTKPKKPRRFRPLKGKPFWKF